MIPLVRLFAAALSLTLGVAAVAQQSGVASPPGREQPPPQPPTAPGVTTQPSPGTATVPGMPMPGMSGHQSPDAAAHAPHGMAMPPAPSPAPSPPR